MAAVTHDNLFINGIVPIDSISMFEFDIQPNQHSKALFSGNTVPESINILKGASLTGTPLSVSAQEGCIYAGRLADININVNNSLYVADGVVVSATVELDQTQKCRSFQDVKMMYSDILNIIVADYTDADYILAVEDRPIGAPIIQYEETDWQFVIRLASHFNTIVMPDTTTGKPCFWFGMRQGYKTREFEKADGGTTVRRVYHEDDSAPGYRKSSYAAHIVKSHENYAIGDKATFRDRELIITQKVARLQNDILHYFYTIASQNSIYRRKIYNERLPGRQISGKILETSGDKVRLHLEIDKAQDRNTAFWYRWAPITSNLFYLMPEVGTRVRLSFLTPEEGDAKATDCVREPQAALSGKMDNVALRGVHTADKKNIILHPEKVGLESESGSVSVMLDDASGVKFDSPTAINITALGKINFVSDQLILKSPTNIGLYAIGAGKIVGAGASPRSSVDFSGPTVTLHSAVNKATLKFDGSPSPIPQVPRSNKPRFDVDTHFEKVAGAVAIASTTNETISSGTAASEVSPASGKTQMAQSPVPKEAGKKLLNSLQTATLKTTAKKPVKKKAGKKRQPSSFSTMMAVAGGMTSSAKKVPGILSEFGNERLGKAYDSSTVATALDLKPNRALEHKESIIPADITASGEEALGSADRPLLRSIQEREEEERRNEAALLEERMHSKAIEERRRAVEMERFRSSGAAYDKSDFDGKQKADPNMLSNMSMKDISKAKKKASSKATQRFAAQIKAGSGAMYGLKMGGSSGSAAAILANTFSAKGKAGPDGAAFVSSNDAGEGDRAVVSKRLTTASAAKPEKKKHIKLRSGCESVNVSAKGHDALIAALGNGAKANSYDTVISPAPRKKMHAKKKMTEMHTRSAFSVLRRPMDPAEDIGKATKPAALLATGNDVLPESQGQGELIPEVIARDKQG